MPRALALIALTMLAPSLAAAQRDPCRTVECGGHGTCFVEQSRALCLCDAGYASLGTVCIETEEPDAMRLRRAPGAGARAAELAASQVGRRRSTIELEAVGDIEPLGHYLAPDEWWCGDFVSWIYATAGIPFTRGEAGGWLITNNLAIAAWYIDHGLWVEREGPDIVHYEPRPGDFVRFKTPSGGGHAGIVHHREGSTLHVVEGNVSGEVMMTPYYFYAANRRILGFGITQLPNEPPHVTAPREVDAVVGQPFVVEAEGRDSGPASLLRYRWSVAEHEAGVTLGVTDEASLSVRCELPGTYRLRVTLSDGELSDTSTVNVTAVNNVAPVVRTQFIDGRLEASLDDDGVPGAATVRWSQISGPDEAGIAQPDALSSEVSFPSPGHYVLRLRADDTLAEASTELEVDAPGVFGCAVVRRRGGRPGRAPVPCAVALTLGSLFAVRRRRARRRSQPSR